MHDHGSQHGRGPSGHHERCKERRYDHGKHEHNGSHAHQHDRSRGRDHSRGMDRRPPEIIALTQALEPKTTKGKLAGELRASAHHLHRSGLNRSGRLHILQILAKYGTMNQRLLQNALGTKPDFLRETLGKLEELDHITRNRNEADKGAIDLEITDSREKPWRRSRTNTKWQCKACSPHWKARSKTNDRAYYRIF